MKKKANVSDNLSSTLISVLIHVLRQPFATVIMVTDTLRHTKRNLPEEELHALFEEIRWMTLKSTRLLDGLCCWMNSQKPDFMYKSQPLILNELIQEANSLYLYDQSRKSITIYIVITEAQIIYADKEMLQFINRSILSNMTSHSSYGGIIGVTCSIESDWITVAFVNEDNELKAPQRKTNTKGSKSVIPKEWRLKSLGIELNICEHMIRQMNGKLWTESLPGQGIGFYYSLPLVNLNSM